MPTSTPSIQTFQALQSGQLDPMTLVNEVCNHLEAREPQLHALLPEASRRTRLTNEAGQLKQRYPDPSSRPTLYGVVVGVKDIFRTDGFPTHAGSQLPHELFTGPEATCVTMLRNAGALVLGKTVTTEFAFAEPGPTRNPHNLEHTPGGSSSGSAASVAAGFCPLALGTQTIGSVIRPAAFCGVVGFKPSYNRIPTQGLIYFSESADHVGFFTPDVPFARLAASVLCRDWRGASAPQAGDRLPVLGIPDGPYLAQASEEALSIFSAQVAHLAQAGYRTVKVPLFADIEQINLRHRAMVAAEVAQVHHEWFPRYQHLYRPRTAAIIREGQAVSPAALEQYRAARGSLRTEIEAVMDQNGIDLWVSPPAVGPAPHGLDSTGDPIMNLPWTNSGQPVIALPAGKAVSALPMGLQVSARYGQDEQLLTWADTMAEVLRKL